MCKELGGEERRAASSERGRELEREREMLLGLPSQGFPCWGAPVFIQTQEPMRGESQTGAGYLGLSWPGHQWQEEPPPT